MSPIGAIANRLTGRNRRAAVNSQNNNNSRGAKSPRSPVAQEEHQSKVEQMLKDPALFAEFKRRVSETNNFSNAGATFVLHEFLEELNLDGTRGEPTSNRRPTYEEKTFEPAIESSPNSPGFNNGFGLFQTLCTMTMEPPSPALSYHTSPLGRFNPCPASPGSVQNLSPTKTPLTPISATTASTSASTPQTPESIDMVTTGKQLSRKKTSSTGRSIPACLEQPSF